MAAGQGCTTCASPIISQVCTAPHSHQSSVVVSQQNQNAVPDIKVSAQHSKPAAQLELGPGAYPLVSLSGLRMQRSSFALKKELEKLSVNAVTVRLACLPIPACNSPHTCSPSPATAYGIQRAEVLASSHWNRDQLESGAVCHVI